MLLSNTANRPIHIGTDISRQHSFKNFQKKKLTICFNINFILINTVNDILSRKYVQITMLKFI